MKISLFIVRRISFGGLLAASNAKFYFQYVSQILSRSYDVWVSRSTALRPGGGCGFLAEASHHIHTGSVAHLFCFALRFFPQGLKGLVVESDNNFQSNDNVNAYLHYSSLCLHWLGVSLIRVKTSFYKIRNCILKLIVLFSYKYFVNHTSDYLAWQRQDQIYLAKYFLTLKWILTCMFNILWTV
jgi:hypothetical protein